VVEPEYGTVYGHIIAGTDNVAFVLPLQTIMNEIGDCCLPSPSRCLSELSLTFASDGNHVVADMYAKEAGRVAASGGRPGFEQTTIPGSSWKDELGMTPTCLSAEPHQPRDNLLHYLGCEKISSRHTFLNELSPDLQDKIMAELWRVKYIRHSLSADSSNRHLLDSLLQSISRWKWSQEFQAGMKRRGRLPDLRRPSYPEDQERPAIHSEYNTDLDHHGYFISFRADKGEIRNTDGLESYTPTQITTTFELDEVKRIPVPELLPYLRQQDPLFDGIRYLHLPANNMAVSQIGLACVRVKLS
jgi:hypothetical protein